LIDTDNVLLTSSGIYEVDHRTEFSEQDTINALLLLTEFDILIFGCRDNGELWIINREENSTI